MEPILCVIRYLFKKQNKYDIEETIDSFFKEKDSFPRFVALAFNIEEIPCKNKYNLFSKFDFDKDNRIAYEYLLENNAEIGKISPYFRTLRDKKNVLSLILTKQIYHIDVQKTLRQINQLIKPLGIILKTKSDIVNTKCLLLLLNVLTDGKVPIESELYDIDDILIESFKKANAPLVIDESCLEVQNEYLFFIQIEIIFDFFSEKVSKLIENNSNEEEISPDLNKRDFIPINLDTFEIIKKKKKKKEENLIRVNQIKFFDNINVAIKSQVILNTVNEIGKSCNLHFDNFHEAFNNDNLLKFLLHLLKDDQNSQNFLNKLMKKSNYSNENKIDIAIEYLKILEPKFSILSLDFQCADFFESSAVLLFINILDYFFLKKSKDDLYDRCYTLLYGRYKKGDYMYMPYYEKRTILREWNTYHMLYNFISSIRCNLKFNLADYFDLTLNHNSSIKVPIIITGDYLNSFSKGEIPPASFYQLQFIFDELDSGDFNHRFAERYLTKIRLLKRVKVPNFDDISNSIKTKIISRFIQKKQYKKSIRKQDNNEADNNNQQINQIEIPKCRLYSERRREFSLESQIIIKSLSLEPIENINDFHYEIEQNLSFHYGVLFKNNLISKYSSEWRDLINHEIADDQKEHKVNSGESAYFLSVKNKYQSTKNKLPIYKLFYFSPKTNEWTLDTDQLEQLYNDRIVNDEVTKVPLILLLETVTEEILQILKTINNLENNEADLDEKDICVFGFCCNQINDIRFDKNRLYDENKGKIKPIFLFLHVPERKQKLRKINLIVPQILLFLSFISDANLVCLEDVICTSQIDFISNLNRLIKSFKTNESEISLFKEECQTKEKITLINEDEEYDDDDNDQNDDEFYKDINDLKNDFLNHVDPNFLNNKMNLFILVPGNHFFYAKPNDKIKDALLFKPFKSTGLVDYEVFFFKPKVIDTYDCIDSLLRTVIHTKNSWDAVCSKFRLIKFFTTSSTYINLNFHAEKQLADLKKIIHNRFLMIPTENKDSTNYFTCVKILQKEMLRSFPIFDNDYFVFHNRILSDLKKKIEEKQNKLLENELSFSSESHLSYLSNIINSRSFWKSQDMDAIKNSHFNFLKEEFLAIIRDLKPKNMLAISYIEYKSILYDQIKKDRFRIKAVFEIVEENLTLKLHREVEVQKGMNYTIRERENEREVKMKIESGQKLEDFLEQDF